ncbi:DsrE family protein [Belnapia sp. F-4-1]|uniref:DsrE family protein n=1 Tax=Belnapia sp. F-4-1 TaxID=1545443 RepID=UPI0005BCB0B0|nr:DsrE family protein [Belnapia sp. F-4-1]
MPKPLGILLISPGHERAHYALVLATGAAALGREVTLFATNAGCRLLLAESPLLADPREAAVSARGVAGIAPLLEAAEELGLRFLACEAGLRTEGLEAAPLRPSVTVAGIASFLAAIGDGQMATL